MNDDKIYPQDKGKQTENQSEWSKENKYDSKVKQLLSEELAELVVSEELIQRTLQAVKQANKGDERAERSTGESSEASGAAITAKRAKHKRSYPYIRYFSMVAAALVIIVAGNYLLKQAAVKDSSGEFFDSAMIGESFAENNHGSSFDTADGNVTMSEEEAEEAVADLSEKLFLEMEKKIMEGTLLELENFSDTNTGKFRKLTYESEMLEYEFHIYPEGRVEAKRTRLTEMQETAISFWCLEYWGEIEAD